MISKTGHPGGAAATWTPLRSIATGGLIAGACDMSYALLWFSGVKGVPWMKIPQSVAGGLIGKSSFDGGMSTVILGLALHWTIALIWAAAYVVVGRRFVPLILRKPIRCGLA